MENAYFTSAEIKNRRRIFLKVEKKSTRSVSRAVRVDRYFKRAHPDIPYRLSFEQHPLLFTFKSHVHEYFEIDDTKMY